MRTRRRRCLNRAMTGAAAAKVVPMSEYEQDSSASTGRFRAFVEGGEEEVPRSRSFPPGVLIAVGVVIVAIIIIAVTL